jgi:hypothetical protein
MGGRMGALLKLPLRIGGGFFGGEAMGDSIPSHSLIGLLVQKLNLSGEPRRPGKGSGACKKYRVRLEVIVSPER